VLRAYQLWDLPGRVMAFCSTAMLNCPLSAAAIVDTGSCGRLEREGGTGTITVAPGPPW